VHGGVLVGEYHAQAVGVREMLGPKTEASSVVQINDDIAVYAAPVVQSAMAPPEIVSAPVRLADAPPVMHVSAPPPVFAEPPPQQTYVAQTYAAPPVTYAAHLEPQHVTAQPLEIHTYAAPMTTYAEVAQEPIMGGTVTMAAPPMSSITMAAPPMSSITMAAPPLTYTTQQMQGAPVLYQHVVA